MKKTMTTLALSLLMPLASQAAQVAIADSGTDFQHEILSGTMRINTAEIPDNMIDDDHNGKVDDVVGWNFAESYGKIFFRDHLNYVHPITFKIFEIIAHTQAGTVTDEEKAFWNEHVASLSKEQKVELVNHLNFYGQYAHGTHVSGMVAKLAKGAQISSMRVFPDTPPADYIHPKPFGEKGIADFLYGLLAQITNGVFDQVGLYLSETKADVANYSLGVSLQTIAKLSLQIQGIEKPSDEQLSAETIRVGVKYEPLGKKWMAGAPNTLFVIAAGNDGTNNDKLPVFPAMVRADNAITVAATLGNTKIADFSNYGKNSVDIAAPGVAMLSSVPSLDNKHQLPMSGTSMAAPYITGVAAMVKDANPKLTAVELKKVLMGTVDRKEWLEGKVISGGVVNPERAVAAAIAAKNMDLTSAIASARNSVADLPTFGVAGASNVKSVLPTPADLKAAAAQLVF